MKTKKNYFDGNEFKDLLHHIEAIRKKVKKNRLAFDEDEKREFIGNVVSKFFSDLKWESKAIGIARNVVLIGNKYVLKEDCPEGKKPRYSVPQKKIKISNVSYVIQPLVDTDEEKVSKMFELLKNDGCVIEAPGYGEDAHPDNVGILDGRLVQFDW